MLGVTIGSACIVLVATVSLIGKNHIVIGEIEGIGSNLVYAYFPEDQLSYPPADQITAILLTLLAK